MSDSLKDQLLGLGFKPAPVAERPRGPRRKDGPPAGGKGARNDRGAGKSARNDHGPGKGAGPCDPQGRKNDRGGSAPAGSGRGRGPRTEGDIDLAKAFAIRAQREKDERIQAEREKQEAARQRREAQAKLAALLQGKGLNVAEAEHVRHFEYGGKIKRVHVTEAQLRALNAGELGVVQLNGRYLVVTADALAEAEKVFPQAVALRVDPNAPAADDPYADPKYQVPDDLIW
ncbi:DUF2058 domain-containing protein [Luteimonas terricola]|uniref:DUF2058 family protein n=1 Tax=Luteimonas terricola TaxID=645597 RepID=A0ABQ2EBB7_9GAMM|nr:DUF2058 family protein [Luteimonas terricola]GGK05000.1 hypothetical protein GCM10011394_12640 [Luteimonas terricola]